MKKILSVALLCSSVLAITSLSPMNAKASEKSNGVSQSTTTSISKSESRLVNIGNNLDRETASIAGANGTHLYWTANNASNIWGLVMSQNNWGDLHKWTFYYDSDMDAYQMVLGPLNGIGHLLGVVGEDASGHVSAHANNGIEAEYWRITVDISTGEAFFQNVKTGHYLYQRRNVVPIPIDAPIQVVDGIYEGTGFRLY